MKKSGFTLIELIVLIVICIAVFGVIVFLGNIHANRALNQKAVKLGIAEYVVENKDTGSTKLVWKNTPVTNHNTIATMTITNNNEVLKIIVNREDI